MHLDDIAGLRFETDDVDAASQSLQVRIGPGGGPKRIHHLEGVFVAVEIERLITGAAPRFKILNARIPCRFDSWEEIGSKHPRSKNGLESVSKRRAHELDLSRHCGTFG